jgi:hypothetical protein
MSTCTSGRTEPLMLYLRMRRERFTTLSHEVNTLRYVHGRALRSRDTVLTRCAAHAKLAQLQSYNKYSRVSVCCSRTLPCGNQLIWVDAVCNIRNGMGVVDRRIKSDAIKHNLLRNALPRLNA